MNLPKFLDLVTEFNHIGDTLSISGEVDETSSQLHIEVYQARSEELEPLEELLAGCVQLGHGISLVEEYDEVTNIRTTRVSDLTTSDEVCLNITDH